MLIFISRKKSRLSWVEEEVSIMEFKMYTYKKCDGPAERVIMGALMFVAAIVGLWYSVTLLLAIF